MTLHECDGQRFGQPGLLCLGIVSAQFLCGVVFAEGSFFKDRRDSMAAQPKSAVTATAAVATRPVTEAPIPSAAPSGTPATNGSAQIQGPAQTEARPEPAPPPPAPVPAPAAAPGLAGVAGAVSDVLATDTFIVGGRQVQIAGVRGRQLMLSGLKGWLSSNGNQLNCSAVGPRYRCVTPNGKDVAMVVLANGAAEVDAGAPPEYRSAQNQARMMHKGIWAQ